MEDVYTIKVKTKPDTRNLYPSERRYSASTVSGLAWVHIALASTAFLLACLALVNPTSDLKRLTLNDTEEKSAKKDAPVFNLTDFEVTTDSANNIEMTTDNVLETNVTEKEDLKQEKKKRDVNYIVVLAPTLLSIFALIAGIASILASVRWYIDRNITILFIMSVLSSIFSFIAFVMIISWFATTEEDMAAFYRDKIPFKDFIIVKQSDVIHKNESHILVKTSPDTEKDSSQLFSKRVLSINILIVAFLELLWSLLSVKISYKGMKSNYKDENETRGNCISVVTTIKGDTKKLPRNGKLVPTKPDIIDHYPSTKIKRIFLAQSDNGFYLKNQNKPKNTETSSEFYKERMMNFLNRCASQANNSEMAASEQSELVLNAIPEVNKTEVTIEIDPEVNTRITPVSWGDTPNHTIYNQNNINFDKIFSFSSAEKGESNLNQDHQENDNDTE